MINHSDRGITHPSDTDTVQSETYHDKSLIEVSLILVILIQLLSCAFWASNTLNTKEILKIYLIEQKIYQYH
jgi:hypothetical protein